jgi:tetratricopeptide (TPR) repeat protein
MLMQMGKLDDAVKQAEAALNLAPSADVELREQLYALKGHFISLSGKLGKPDSKEGGIASARAAVQYALSSNLNDTAKASLILEARKRLEAEGLATSQPGLAITALLAWAATLSAHSKLAEELSERVGASKHMRPRLWVNLGHLYRQHQLNAPSDDLSEAAVKRRQEALETLEQLVNGFVHIKDIEGVHAACR